jgi:hypothetical protein
MVPCGLMLLVSAALEAPAIDRLWGAPPASDGDERPANLDARPRPVDELEPSDGPGAGLAYQCRAELRRRELGVEHGGMGRRFDSGGGSTNKGNRSARRMGATACHRGPVRGHGRWRMREAGPQGSKTGCAVIRLPKATIRRCWDSDSRSPGG